MSFYKIYVNDALEMISRIEKETKSLGDLKKDKDIDSTLMRLQVIGESIKKLPQNIKKKFPDVKWKKIARMRNFISHEYFRVLPEIVIQIVKNDLPKLKEALRELKNE